MDLGEYLEALGWSKAYLARRLGIHHQTVYQWDEVPKYAIRYMDICLKIKRIWEEEDA